MNPKATTDAQIEAANARGTADYRAGIVRTECPYKTGSERLAWFLAWDAAWADDARAQRKTTPLYR